MGGGVGPAERHDRVVGLKRSRHVRATKTASREDKATRSAQTKDKEQNPNIEIVGLQPCDGSSIPGIRRWPEAYLPSIFERTRVDRVIDVDQRDAEVMMKRLAAEEGVFCGVSSGGSVVGALKIAENVENAVIVAIICDRGDRYLSTGVFDSTLQK